jgi:hypothetical protein
MPMDKPGVERILPWEVRRQGGVMLRLPSPQKEAASRPLETAQHRMKAGRQEARMQERRPVMRRRMVTGPGRGGLIESLQGGQLV